MTSGRTCVVVVTSDESLADLRTDRVLAESDFDGGASYRTEAIGEIRDSACY